MYRSGGLSRISQGQVLGEGLVGSHALSMQGDLIFRLKLVGGAREFAAKLREVCRTLHPGLR